MTSVILGPFVGHTTDSSIKIWLRDKRGGRAYIQLFRDGNREGKPQLIEFSKENLWAAVATFSSLHADTEYSYRIFYDVEGETPFLIEGLNSSFMKVRTMPGIFDWERYRYDFILMSCNNPDQCIDKKAGRDGYEVWKTVPSIIEAHQAGDPNARILFALMGGDQVYADDWRKKLLQARTVEEKVETYFEVYEHYWGDPRYRQVLAGLPAYLMWDDHDIMDGWGSETSSFNEESGKVTASFKPEWATMFIAAKRAFRFYQAARNPNPLIPYSDESSDTFDVGFRVGPIGFILADLRSNRNWQARTFWTKEQVGAVESWIRQNREEIEVLFFLTPVVVAHGSPIIEEGLVKNWDLVLKFFNHARESQRKVTKGGIGLLKGSLIALVIFAVLGWAASLVISKSVWVRGIAVGAPAILSFFVFQWARKIKRADILREIELIKSGRGRSTFLGWILHLIGLFLPPDILDTFDNKAGDLSDDIRDSWAGDGNESSAESLLQLLFDLQNDSNENTCVQVAILSGDIHAGGYSNIYSSQELHQRRPVIPHIVSSPVGYSPFPWFAEAFYRKFSIGSVRLGSSNSFYAQNSHYFTERNVAICSIRKGQGDKLVLKTKFYVEGFSEPQTTVFDLKKVSHREDIKWQV